MTCLCMGLKGSLELLRPVEHMTTGTGHAEISMENSQVEFRDQQVSSTTKWDPCYKQTQVSRARPNVCTAPILFYIFLVMLLFTLRLFNPSCKPNPQFLMPFLFSLPVAAM